MGIIVKKPKYELADEGLHNVVISRIDDVGLVETKLYGTKDMAAIFFTCLDQSAKDGSDVDLRYVVSKKITRKSKLGLMLVALKVTSGDEFDLDDLIGLKVQIVVQHNTAEDGRVFANIMSFVPVKRGVEQV